MPGQVPPRENTFDYNSIPDGEKVLDKLVYVLKPTVTTAGFLAICDILTFGQPKGYVNTAVRFGAVSLPIIGAASTFVLVTNGLGSLRKKNDHLNWFVGGFVTGSIAGLLKRNRMWGFNVGMLGGILALIQKEISLNGWESIPSNPKRYLGNGTVCLRDYSLYAERPRNWTTGPAQGS